MNSCFKVLLVCGCIFPAKNESIHYLGKCVSTEEWRFLDLHWRESLSF